MSSQVYTDAERRDQTRSLIDKLLRERQEMLVLFCRIAGLEPRAQQKALQDLLQEFCQVLVDYTAFGHFEIFDRVANDEERRQRMSAVADEVYPRIVESADAVIAFNDRYDASAHDLDLTSLPDDLSRLGEEIAVRIEMEDRIISQMLSR